MTHPRTELISLDDTPYYHCVSRCVRRAFLCGSDHQDDKTTSYEHRRGWLTNRIKQLSSIFAINIAAYAVMSNHYHLVLRVDSERAENWTQREIIQRWQQLFRGPALIQRFLRNPDLSKAELDKVEEITELWRERLYSISWFMKCLNEPIARAANKEDNCTGHFFEGRFKSQALLDETALLSCMVYVDLNPIRACMADSPEASDYTSIQERLGIEPEVLHSTDETELFEQGDSQAANNSENQVAELLPFAGDEHIGNSPQHIPYHFAEYLQLVDWTGRMIKKGKRGAIHQDLPPILQRLNITPEQWLKTSCNIEQNFYRAIGPITKLDQLCEKLQQNWLHGKAACLALYGAANSS